MEVEMVGATVAAAALAQRVASEVVAGRVVNKAVAQREQATGEDVAVAVERAVAVMGLANKVEGLAVSGLAEALTERAVVAELV